MKTVKLSSGEEIFCLNKSEAIWLYEEVQGYLKHGIQLHPGDIVFDVGANIGTFTLYVNKLLENQVKVYSFEPIPAIFEILQQNIQQTNPENLKAFCYGLSTHSSSIKFDYYPRASLMSSATHSSSEVKRLARELLVRHPEHAPFPGSLLRWTLPVLRGWWFDRFANSILKPEEVTCQLRSISEVLKEEGIEHIDLLKVDVEKGEMDVLLGIASQDWQKIKQVVIEIHNLNDRVNKIQELLRAQGFTSITIEQEYLFEGSENFNLYACR